MWKYFVKKLQLQAERKNADKDGRKAALKRQENKLLTLIVKEGKWREATRKNLVKWEKEKLLRRIHHQRVCCVERVTSDRAAFWGVINEYINVYVVFTVQDYRAARIS